MSSRVPEFLLDRLSSLSLPRVRQPVVAYSGGLDSLVCLGLLRHVYGNDEVRPIIGDVGQPEDGIQAAIDRAQRSGHEAVEVLDLRSDLLDDWLPRAIRANAAPRGYPMAAPMVKQILGRRLGELAIQRGYDAVVEGASGVGNDQFRFAAALARFAPEIRHVAPIRELQLNRAEELQLARAWDLPNAQDQPPGGDDTTPWCRSIGSGAMRLDEPLNGLWLRWVANESPAVDNVKLAFSGGVPVGLDGRTASLLDLLEELNRRAGRCGIGLVDVIEDLCLGTKSREVYEAPAALLILAAKQELEGLCLTREELTAKEGWEREWTSLVYRGDAYHPLVNALDAAIEVVQRRVTGEVSLRLDGGRWNVLARRSPLSLLPAQPNLSDAPGDRTRAIAGALELHRQRYVRFAQLDRQHQK